MRIQHDFEVGRGAEAVWTRLWDVELVASCIRGCSEVQTIEPLRAYSATVTQTIGPFHVAFPLAIDIREAQPPARLTVSASGRDNRIASRVQGTLTTTLAEVARDRTRVAIDMELSVQGRLATLGHGIIERKGRDELTHFADELRRALSEPTEAGDA